jgi:transcriptional regulator with XRE-family HTH domain
MLIGTVIRKWRHAEDLGLRDAAKLIGVTHATLSRIERGKPMGAATLVKLLAWMFSEPNGKKR